ncbi:MAG: hypothetical protein Q7S07_05990 [Candidatus Omnitrophota bacterium]|nr:hypothetical protein [Candidatus Omnitrophota bacterium]
MKIMIAAKSALKIFKDENYRIFAISILTSLVWHLFWMSTIVIVSRPDNKHNVKFSKVSFLGPLLGKGAMELQARPKERSFLETRYLGRSNRSPALAMESMSLAGPRYESGNDAYHLMDGRMTASIDDALDGKKPEPSDAE